ncbi:MAG: hypothetical protein L0Z53_19280 [Acidobacteriales bacterium]|nr:hypothetical protein [Terriglobales bacterium]
MLRTLRICLILLAIAFGGSGQSALCDIESLAGAYGAFTEPTASGANQAPSQFQRPTGIYAIGLRAQPPPRDLLEKPFVDGVALAQEWRTVETAKGNYDFSTIDATLALLEQYKKKLTLTIFPFRAPDYLINDPQVQTYLVAHAGPNITLPVPWDATGLARHEALFKALGDHLVPNAAQGGAKVPFRDHPLMAGMPAWPMGMNGIRDVCLAGNRCPAIYDVPNYSRETLTNGILRSLHVIVDQFPNQFHYVPLFRINDRVTSPPLDGHLLAVIKQDFFNGSRPPQMGLYQENLSCRGPNTAGAPALFQEQNNTYTMIQALQSWLTLAPYNSPGSTDPCLVTTVPNDRTTAVSGPEVGIQHAYQTFGCRYFEIYLSDLLHPGFADEFEQWSKILTSPLTSVSAASYSGATLARGSIVAAFGADLASATVAATTTPLPTTLGGTTVKVRDSAGAERLAPLFFVSPTQINYQIPAGTATGPAMVTITTGDSIASAGTVQIAAVAPGLFTANASGQGFAAAVALRVKADGTQSFEPVARFDAAVQQFVAIPIDLGPESDQVFLILFGTGIRLRSSLSAVSANLGGVDAQVAFAGAQDGFVGLDQVNVRLPRSLIGRGAVDVALTVDGQAANTVKVSIK